jgi:coproporphyrinogen III oxidase
MRERARAFVEDLQDRICARLEALDGRVPFREDRWERPGGGGGRSRVLEGGGVFEKAGVNVSTVFGDVPPALAEVLEGDGGDFWATGISLVLHPESPHVPTTHANFRMVARGDDAWFGGGADLTPYVLYDEDARHFHRVLRETCDRHDPSFHARFKVWCDRYFFLPHRGETRGVGGLFFDHLRPGDPGAGGLDAEALFAFWCDCAEAFVPAYLPIAERRRETPWTEAERLWQLRRRSRYVEFNLLYDRGTAFGLRTGGRIESIFMSMPPLLRFDYDVKPAPGSPEARLLDVLRSPRDWLA